MEHLGLILTMNFLRAGVLPYLNLRNFSLCILSHDRYEVRSRNLTLKMRLVQRKLLLLHFMPLGEGAQHYPLLHV